VLIILAKSYIVSNKKKSEILSLKRKKKWTNGISKIIRILVLNCNKSYVFNEQMIEVSLLVNKIKKNPYHHRINYK